MLENPLPWPTIHGAAAALRKKETTPIELVRHCLAEIDRREEAVHLLLHQNILYVAFGGHCDRPAGPNRSYHGWVFAYDVSVPKQPKRVAVFCTTPNGKGTALESRAGIWMSGNGPVAG